MPPTRRSLLAASLGLPLATPAIRRACAATGEITFAGYAGIFQDNYQQVVIDPFMRANPGVRVTYYQMGNSAQALGLLRAQKAAPQIDAVIMDVSVAKAASDENLFEPLDPADMPVLKQLSPRAFTPGVTAPAVTFDNLVLLYSPERVKPAPTSWKVMWDPRYKEQITLNGVPDIVGLGFLMMANKISGGADFRQLDRGLAAVADMAPGVLSWDPKPDAYNFIINGTASLGVGWNARGQTYAAQSECKLAAVLPDEGSLFQVNVMGLVRNSRQSDAARAFVAYTLGAEAQKAFTERMFYAPTNTTAQVSEAALAKTAASPERQAMMLDVNWLEVAKIREGVTEQWRRRVLTRR